MSPLIIFTIGVVGFLVLVFIGMPIAFAFFVIGFIGTILIQGIGPGLSLLGTAPWQWASQNALIVVPLFILMGQFAFQSGISRDLYVAAYKWLGKLPGGLALATSLASAGFAACTGVTPAAAAAMGTIAFPEMEQFNYDRRLSTGCIAAGGTLGILIPPSITLIIYGFLAQQDISKLFIAGIFPGLMLTALFMITIVIMCARNPKLGPRGESFPWKEKLFSLTGIWGMLVLFIVVIGGLYAGVFAPSEAGAIGAFGAFIIALGRRRLNIKLYISALKDSLRLTVMALTILVGAMVFGIFITVSGVPAMFTEWITGLHVSRHAILVIILVMYIPLGMVLDALSMILLTIPTFCPIIAALGFDLIWFGILIVLLEQIALITPPVGMVSYVLQGVTKVPLEEVFRGIMPFVIALVVGVVILVAFPQIILFLPNTMG